jgi:hypothetical protein
LAHEISHQLAVGSRQGPAAKKRQQTGAVNTDISLFQISLISFVAFLGARSAYHAQQNSYCKNSGHAKLQV